MEDDLVVLIVYFDGSAVVLESDFLLRAAPDVLVLSFSFFERLRLSFSSTGLLYVYVLLFVLFPMSL